MADKKQNKKRSLQIETLAHRVMLDASGIAEPVFYGPTSYLSENDIPQGFVPVPDCEDCVFEIETFEDNSLDHGLQLSAGQILFPGFSTGIENLTDSVDGDDGVIDGTGQTNGLGHSYFSASGTITVTLPSLMQSAGVAWTDADPSLTNVIFEAFDQDGNSLGTIEAGDIADGEFTGQTQEDSFFGVTYGNGIDTGVTSFTITNVQQGTGIEIDHIMFANCSACCEIDLELTKSVDTPTADVGDTITWTIELTNTDTAAISATGVQVGDTLPSGITSVSNVIASNGTFDTNTGVWTLADPLAPGATATLSYSTTLDSVTPGVTLVNVAEVIAANENDFDSTVNNDDGDQSEDDEDAATVNVEAIIDLELTKTVDKTIVEDGELVVWRIEVTNNGQTANTAATGVSIDDLLPSGVTLVGNFMTEGQFNPLDVTWTLVDPLEPGETEYLLLNTTVDAGLDGGSVLTNVAQIVSADQTDIDSTPNNDDGDQSEDDEDNASVTIGSLIDLEVTKSVNASVVNAGDEVTWTIEVTNNAENANAAATGVQLTDLIPAGVTLSGLTVDVGTAYDLNTNVWTLATPLAPGESKTLTIKSTIDDGLDGGQMIVNTAYISAANETDVDSEPVDANLAEDDADDAKVTVAEIIDLEVTKSVDVTGPVQTGDTVVWTIEVTNDAANANTAATGVSIAELLPADVTLAGIVVSEGTYDLNSAVWTLADPLEPGEVETLTVTTTIDEGLAGGTMLQNVVQVISADQADIDSTPNNDDGDQSEDDEANAKVTVGEVIDLEVTKTMSLAGTDQTLPGTDVFGNITVTNNAENANASATGVQLKDTLPSGLTLLGTNEIDTVTENGDGTFTWSLDEPLAPGESRTLQVVFSLGNVTGGDMLTNVVEVIAADQVDFDSIPSNDDGDQSEDDEDNAKITIDPIIDLEVTKSVSHDVVAPGEEVKWTIELSNDARYSNIAATGVQLADVLPAGLTLTGNSLTAGTFDPVGVIWTLTDPLAPGEAETLTLTTVVDLDVADGTMLTNVAEVTAADQTDYDSTPNNDTGDQVEDDEDSAKITVEVAPQLMLSGFSYIDTNDDGIFQEYELPLLGVEIMLSGTDNQGNEVNLSTFTNIDGFYKFNDLNPGFYTVMQVQPIQFVDGQDTVGNLGGSNSVNDKLVVNLTDNGEEYNFGELGLRPEYTNKRLYLTSTPYTDWQYVDVRETSVWYSFDAEHRSYLDIYGQLPPNGVATYTVYDAHMNVVATGPITSLSSTAVPLQPGEYHVQFSGNSVIEELSVDVTRANVNVDGATVIAVGTASDDVIELDLGELEHTLTINGLEFVFDADEVTNFHLGGSTGHDDVIVHATSLDDTASVIGDRGELTSSRYDVNTYSIEDTTFIGGGGTDKAQLYGSLVDDVFSSLPNESTMTTPHNVMHMADFYRVDAYGRAGNDRAFLYGTQGDDQYVSRDEYTVLNGAANGYVTKTKGFERVDAYGRGGNDIAELHGSTGNDRYISTETYASIRTPDRATVAKGFETVRANAVAGGHDDAFVYHLMAVDKLFLRNDLFEIEREDRDEELVGFGSPTLNAKAGHTVPPVNVLILVPFTI